LKTDFQRVKGSSRKIIHPEAKVEKRGGVRKIQS
jgi:hypothetical protein